MSLKQRRKNLKNFLTSSQKNRKPTFKKKHRMDKTHFKFIMKLLKEEEKDLEEQLKKDTKIFSKKGVIIIFLFLLALIILAIFWNTFSRKIIVWIFHRTRKILDLNFPFNFGIILMVDMVWITFNIPGLTFLTMIIASLSQNFWATFLTVMLSHNIHAFSTYYILAKCLRKKLDRKLRRHILYRLMKNEGKHSPILVSFMIRCIGAVQTMIKSLIISLSEVSFKIFYFTFMVQVTFESFFVSFVGVNIEFDDEGKRVNEGSFGEKSKRERVNIVFTYIIAAFSLIIVLSIPILAKKRIAEFKKKEKRRMIFALRCKFLLEGEIKKKVKDRGDFAMSAHAGIKKIRFKKRRYSVVDKAVVKE